MFFQYFVFPSPFPYYDLSFDMQKPSHITNIHWKFCDFFPSGLWAIKVLHFTVRSEDGEVSEIEIKDPNRYLWAQNWILLNELGKNWKNIGWKKTDKTVKEERVKVKVKRKKTLERMKGDPFA